MFNIGLEKGQTLHCDAERPQPSIFDLGELPQLSNSYKPRNKGTGLFDDADREIGGFVISLFWSFCFSSHCSAFGDAMAKARL